MPANEKHVMANVARIESGDNDQLRKEWTEASSYGLSTVKTWELFVDRCDSLRIADKLPGSVGHKFAKKYAEEDAAPTKRTRATLYVNQDTAYVLIDELPDFVVTRIGETGEYEVRIADRDKACAQIRAAINTIVSDRNMSVKEVVRLRIILNKFLVRVTPAG
jgi:hypothetical protein